MIKINIILNNRAWYNYIKNPSKLIEKQNNLLNKKFKKYKKNIFFCSLLLSGDAEIKRLNKNIISFWVGCSGVLCTDFL